MAMGSQHYTCYLLFILITRFADTYGTGSTESTVTYKLDLVLLMGRKPEDSNIDV